jgi:hypothetical protein
VDDRAEKLARQLESAEKMLFALEAYLSQARQVIAQTRAVLKEALPGSSPSDPPGGPVK